MASRAYDKKNGLLPKVKPENFKLIPPFYAQRKVDGLYLEPQLYNIVKDPAESLDLAGEHPEIVEKLLKELDWFDNLENQPQYGLK